MMMNNFFYVLRMCDKIQNYHFFQHETTMKKNMFRFGNCKRILRNFAFLEIFFCKKTKMGGIITLTTDWGYGDSYEAMFKAHVWRENPQAVFTAISHAVRGGSIRHAAFLLSSACWCFPESTVHVADVREFTLEQLARMGRRERPLPFLDFLAVRCRGQYFLMENNGLLSLLSPDFADVDAVVKIPLYEEYKQYDSFNALNYYAHAAALLSAGEGLEALGQPYPMEQLERLAPFKVRINGDSLEGSVQHVDAKGNLITDIRQSDVEAVAAGRKSLSVKVAGCLETLAPVTLCRRYLTVKDSCFFALFNTAGFLEIGQKNVSLAAFLYGDEGRSGIGDPVTLTFTA